MIKIETTINNTQATYIIVEKRSELKEARKVSQETGRRIGYWNFESRFEADDRDEFREDFPETTKAIEDANINIDDVVAIYEVQ